MNDELAEEIGAWSKDKIEIVAKYAEAYMTIFKARRQEFLKPIYIDAFCGSGIKIARESGEKLPGSPLRMLMLEHKFSEYHFVDIDGDRIRALKKQVEKLKLESQPQPPLVVFHEGEANQLLLKQIIPTIQRPQYKRAVLFLDPYGFDVKWEVVLAASQMGTIDIILNFSIAALNRYHVPLKMGDLTQDRLDKMSELFGLDWEKDLYKEATQMDFIKTEFDRIAYDDIVKCYARRLVNLAGFEFVSEPKLFLNSKNAPQYYLFLASHKVAAKNIMDHLVKRERS